MRQFFKTCSIRKLYVAQKVNQEWMTKSEELIHLLNDNAYKSKKCNWYCQKLPKFCNFCYTEASLVKNKETSSNAARLTMDYNLYIWRIAFARKILGEFMSFILHCQYTTTKQILKLTLVFSKLGTFWNVSNILLVCMTSLHLMHHRWLFWRFFNPFVTDIGPLKPNSEHIHASDKYISSFISVRSFTSHNRVKESLNVTFSHWIHKSCNFRL